MYDMTSSNDDNVHIGNERGGDDCWSGTCAAAGGGGAVAAAAPVDAASEELLDLLDENIVDATYLAGSNTLLYESMLTVCSLEVRLVGQ